MKPKSSWFMALSIAALLASASVTASTAQTLTIGVRGGPDSIDPHFTATGTHAEALEARLRYADLVRRRSRGRASPRRELEGARCHDLGVQAAQGREVPRRLGLHRRRRQVLDRAYPDRRRPESDHDLCAAREGGEGRRPPHDPHHHGWPGAGAAERLHPAVHRIVEGSGRPHQGDAPTRPSTAARRPSAPVRTSMCPGRRRAISSWTASTAIGGRRSRGRGTSARRSRTMLPASRN